MGTNVELDCKTPRDVLNFCRPRSGTNYESVKGSGPGFFEHEDDGVASKGKDERSAKDEQNTARADLGWGQWARKIALSFIGGRGVSTEERGGQGRV